jgi:hypothetical protein
VYIAEIVDGKAVRVPTSRFLFIDGKPVRYVDDDGTLLGVVRFGWGKKRADAVKAATAALKK